MQTRSSRTPVASSSKRPIEEEDVSVVKRARAEDEEDVDETAATTDGGAPAAIEVGQTFKTREEVETALKHALPGRKPGWQKDGACLMCCGCKGCKFYARVKPDGSGHWIVGAARLDHAPTCSRVNPPRQPVLKEYQAAPEGDTAATIRVGLTFKTREEMVAVLERVGSGKKLYWDQSGACKLECGRKTADSTCESSQGAAVDGKLRPQNSLKQLSTVSMARPMHSSTCSWLRLQQPESTPTSPIAVSQTFDSIDDISAIFSAAELEQYHVPHKPVPPAGKDRRTRPKYRIWQVDVRCRAGLDWRRRRCEGYALLTSASEAGPWYAESRTAS